MDKKDEKIAELEKIINFLKQVLKEKQDLIIILERQEINLKIVVEDLVKKNKVVFDLNRQAQENLEKLKIEVKTLHEKTKKLLEAPFSYGTFIRVFDSVNRRVDIFYEGRVWRGVNVDPGVNIENLKPGMIVRVMQDLGYVVSVVDSDVPLFGEESYFDSEIDRNRIRVRESIGDRKYIVFKAYSFPESLEVGDPVLVYGGFAFEKLRQTDKDYFLEEIPNVTFEDIGGLDDQIKIIRDELELPFLHPEVFKKLNVPLPKGVLLYGPPGCGKTMIAKAIANNLAQRISEKLKKKVESRFINIQGPELLNKYVGETERTIRKIFDRANKLALADIPVIIFFDEIDSFLRARGSGISSDVESTNVPQFCAKIDGLSRIQNVIVIGATNRQDLLDPAVLRPGRFDIKIKVARPDREKAEQILRKKLQGNYQFHKSYENSDIKNPLTHIINTALNNMFTPGVIVYKDDLGRELERTNEFVQITFANGASKKLYYYDFLSGAMLESIVTRAKKLAIKKEIEKNEVGLRARYFCSAVEREYIENEDLPNSTNPQEWAKILGIKDRVVDIKFLSQKVEEKKSIEIKIVPTGNYL